MHCCYSKHHTAEPEDRLPISTMYFKQGLPALDLASRHHGAAGHAYCICVSLQPPEPRKRHDLIQSGPPVAQAYPGRDHVPLWDTGKLKHMLLWGGAMHSLGYVKA